MALMLPPFDPQELMLVARMVPSPSSLWMKQARWGEKIRFVAGKRVLGDRL